MMPFVPGTKRTGTSKGDEAAIQMGRIILILGAFART
jgi:hypothetical protein